MLTNIDSLFQALKQCCEKHDLTWMIRKRLINTHFLLIFLIKAVTDTNSSGLGTVLGRLHFFSTILSLEISQIKAASSICVARYKVGWVIFRRLNNIIVNFFEQMDSARYKWKGHRIFTVDGSKINLPKELKKSKYKTANQCSSRPMAMVTSLFRLKAQITYDFIISRHSNEITNSIEHLKKTKPGDVVVYDRYYISTVLLNNHLDKNIEFVFRCKEKSTFKEIERFANSDLKDEIITITRKGLKINIRFVKYWINDVQYVLATSLLNQKKYPINSLKDLYHKRWGIEEHYKTMKEHVQIEQFHCKKIMGIKQEIGVFFA